MNYEEAMAHMRGKIGLTVLTSIADDDMLKCITFIKEETDCDDQTAKIIWCDLKLEYGNKDNNPIMQAREDYQQEKLLEECRYAGNAECPYCHSKNTKKISGMSKAGSVALFGIFAAGKVSKQWHCNSCKSDF